mmetsp:Transcript_5176/g.14482  ORF Transcript_5176/g.14482 Transcript_5176/m.14482 type:complete len:585 (+) Transcript_5176:264-2018(+)
MVLDLPSDPKGASGGSGAKAFADAILATAGLDFAATALRLLELKACCRCCLRFAGCQAPLLYCQPAPAPAELHHELKAAQGNSPESPTLPAVDHQPWVCCVCLGALQQGEEWRSNCTHEAPLASRADPASPAWAEAPHPEGGVWHELGHGLERHTPLAERLTHSIQAEAHQFSEFDLEILVPSASELRTKAMKAALKRDGLLLSEELSLNIALRNHLLPTIEKATGASYVRGAGMQITLALHHASIAEEARGLLSEAGPSAKTGRKRKHGWHGRGGAATAGVAPGHELLVKQCSRRALQEAAEALSDGQLEERCGMPPRPNLSEPAAAAVRCMRRADGGASGGAYLLAGRYRKLRRGLSQSPWIIDGAQKGSGSVQELIESWAMPHLKADSCKFVTAGREDIDVRMLGNGRPFILEIFNPRSLMPPPEVWETLAKDLKQADLGVEVVAPQGVSRDLYSRMKEGESEKEKTYAAVVWLSRAITPDDIAAIGAYQSLAIQQATPVRVLHRRAALTRERLILHMSMERVPGCPQYGVLTLKTSAGTYIKEFVHGDFGRTQPNLGSLLGCKAQILQLDVLDVHLDFLS